MKTLDSLVKNLIKEQLVKIKHNVIPITNIMNTNTNSLLISPESIRKRSEIKVGSRSKHKISTRQSKLLAKASVNYYASNIKQLNISDLSDAIALAIINPMKISRKGVFSVLYDDKAAKMTTTISRARILPIDYQTAYIIAPSYRSIKNYTNKFSSSFQDFLGRKGDNFYGLTKAELKKGERSSSKDIGETLYTNKEHSQAEGPRKAMSVNTILQPSTSRIDLDNNYNLSTNVEESKTKLKSVKNIAYRYDLKTKTSRLKNIAAKFNLIVESEIITKDFFNKVRLSPEQVFTNTGFVSGAVKTLLNFFFKDLKKANNKKSLKVKVPKISRGKDVSKKKSGNIKIPDNIVKETLKNSPVYTQKIKKISELEINIVILEEVEKDDCGISVRKLLAIQGRLNYELHDAIRMNMKRPALVYRTGRFANSVKVIIVKRNPNCSLTAFYDYQTRPYSVFDPSISHYNNLSSEERNPQKIIGDSIRSIASGIMKDRYTIHPQWI